MKKMKAAELVEDFDIYPRQQVNSQHQADMTEAWRAGVEFPPVLIDKASKRIVDGIHRKRSKITAHGKDTEIDVVEKKYANQREMLLDAMRYNAQHGQPFTNLDRTRVILLAAKLKIGKKHVAAALGISIERVDGLRTTKTAQGGNGEIAIKRAIRHKAGDQLTKRQVEANKKLGGMDQPFMIDQLIELIEADLIDQQNQNVTKGLKRLRKLLEGF